MRIIRLTIALLVLAGGIVAAQEYNYYQNTSGANMVFVGDRLYSDQVIAKFGSHIIEFPEGMTPANGFDIKRDYPDVSKIFQAICDREGFTLENILFYKAISGREPGQVTVYSPRKGCMVTVPDLSLAYIIKFPKPVDVQLIIDDLQRLNEVEYAHQPVQTIEYATSPPNDP